MGERRLLGQSLPLKLAAQLFSGRILSPTVQGLSAILDPVGSRRRREGPNTDNSRTIIQVLTAPAAGMGSVYPWIVDEGPLLPADLRIIANSDRDAGDWDVGDQVWGAATGPGVPEPSYRHSSEFLQSNFTFFPSQPSSSSVSSRPHRHRTLPHGATRRLEYAPRRQLEAARTVRVIPQRARSVSTQGYKRIDDSLAISLDTVLGASVHFRCLCALTSFRRRFGRHEGVQRPVQGPCRRRQTHALPPRRRRA